MRQVLGNQRIVDKMDGPQKECLHGLTFDEAEARKILAKGGAGPEAKTAIDAAVRFINGNPAVSEIRKRWPRGFFTIDKPCPMCGFTGIAYVSYTHYLMGDW